MLPPFKSVGVDLINSNLNNYNVGSAGNIVLYMATSCPSHPPAQKLIGEVVDAAGRHPPA